MPDTVLEVQNLSAGYGGIRVLHDISLKVEKGRVVAVLGTNGAGKTSLLRALSGLIAAEQGVIRLMQREVTNIPAHKLPAAGMVHVPEGRHIFGTMTIRENLELGAFTVADAGTRHERIDKVFEIFPILAERQGQDARYLSGGQQQMLAIGRGLMAAPTLLLLDEPSMGLAPIMVKEIMVIIDRLRESGITILLVEQNSRVALRHADYGYLLELGRIVREGCAAELARDDSIVRTYLGEV
jgi:branched-chain amino acid transport system ATP-binding protein